MCHLSEGHAARATLIFHELLVGRERDIAAHDLGCRYEGASFVEVAVSDSAAPTSPLTRGRIEVKPGGADATLDLSPAMAELCLLEGLVAIGPNHDRGARVR